ncbi:MAG: DUF333 domain-containing protein [Candidatus Promineifilaceae bacterium]|jgi:putative hemolysin
MKQEAKGQGSEAGAGAFAGGQGAMGALIVGCWLVIMVLLPGCAQEAQAPTAVPEEAPAQTPAQVLAARRAVLNFLREGANECVPPAGVIWQEQPGVAPAGFDVYRFDSEGCQMTISYPLPETAATLYHVTLHNRVSGFCWQANVDSKGAIAETGTAAGILPELANAAAAYCKEQGGVYEEQDQSDGVRCGMCVLADGRSCNAWAFFQGICS